MTKKELLKTFLMNNAQRNIVYTVYGQSKKLPDEYQEVEYLESTGTQWIDSGWVPQINPKFETKIQVGTASSDCVLGVRGYDTPKLGYFGLWTNGNIAINYATYDSSYIYSTNVTQAPHIIKNDNVYLYRDGILVNASASIVEYTIYEQRSVYLFCLHGQDNKASRNSKVKIFYCKFYDNNTLVRNFIPCYRKADNVAGMYDLVNGQFYTNQGTGSFIVGNDVPSTIVSIKPPISFGEKKLGKNLFDTDNFVSTFTNFDISYKTFQDKNCVNIKRSNNTTQTYTIANLKTNTQYTISMLFADTYNDYYFSFVYSDGTSSSIRQQTQTSNLTKITATSLLDKTLVGINLQLYGWANDIYLADIQLEEGSTATAYEPYIGDLRGIGEVKDILETSGTLTKKLGEVDLGSLKWTYYASRYFFATLPNLKIYDTKITGNKFVSSKYTNATRVDNVYDRDKQIGIGGGGWRDGCVNIHDSSYTDATTFKTAMQGVKLIYELATPTETTFTPLELTSGLTVVDSNGTTPEYTEN